MLQNIRVTFPDADGDEVGRVAHAGGAEIADAASELYKVFGKGAQPTEDFADVASVLGEWANDGHCVACELRVSWCPSEFCFRHAYPRFRLIRRELREMVRRVLLCPRHLFLVMPARMWVLLRSFSSGLNGISTG